MCIFSYQAKEAGADDVLDISKCELLEVCSLELSILADRSDFSVYLIANTRFNIMSVSFGTEMALCPGHFFLCLYVLWFSGRGKGLFLTLCCPTCCFHSISVLGILFHLTAWEGQSDLRHSLGGPNLRTSWPSFASHKGMFIFMFAKS